MSLPWRPNLPWSESRFISRFFSLVAADFGFYDSNDRWRGELPCPTAPHDGPVVLLLHAASRRPARLARRKPEVSGGVASLHRAGVSLARPMVRRCGRGSRVGVDAPSGELDRSSRARRIPERAGRRPGDAGGFHETTATRAGDAGELPGEARPRRRALWIPPAKRGRALARRGRLPFAGAGLPLARHAGLFPRARLPLAQDGASFDDARLPLARDGSLLTQAGLPLARARRPSPDARLSLHPPPRSPVVRLRSLRKGACRACRWPGASPSRRRPRPPSRRARTCAGQA